MDKDMMTQDEMVSAVKKFVDELSSRGVSVAVSVSIDGDDSYRKVHIEHLCGAAIMASLVLTSADIVNYYSIPMPGALVN